MKGEAINHLGFKGAPPEGLGARRAGDGDLFAAVLESIFAARLQCEGAGAARAKGGGPGPGAPADPAPGQEQGLPLQEQSAVQGEQENRLFKPLELVLPQPPAAAEGDPFFARLMQEWAELPAAAQELLKLILSGLLAAGKLSPEDLPAGAGESQAGAFLPESSGPLPGETTGQLFPQLPPQPGEGQPGRPGFELGSRQLERSWSEPEAQGLGPLSRQQELTPQSMAFIRQFLAAVAAPVEEGARSQDLPSKLGDLPPWGDRPLTSGAAAVPLDNLQEGKLLARLPAETLELLHGYLLELETLQEGDGTKAGEKESTPGLLGRVEKFWQYLFSGGREGAGNSDGQPLPEKEQLKPQALPLEKPQHNKALESEGGRFDAVPSARAEGTAAVRAAPAYASSFKPNEVMAQVMERLALLARPGIQELRLRLQPEYLGNLLIRLRNVQGVLSAEIVAQHGAVKELLESQLDNLRQRFQELNLAVEEFRVLVGGDGREGRGGARFAPTESLREIGTKKGEQRDAGAAPAACAAGGQQLVDLLA